MKKILFSSLILGSAFALASCSADEPGVKSDGPVTLTVQLPAELATRFGDGSQVNILYYSILNQAGTAVLDSGSQEWVEGSTSASVTLDLIPAQEYQVVFFAMNTGAKGYTFNATTAALSVNYDNVAVNNEAYDAFCAKVPGISTTYDTSVNPIELSRPFAQINIGTSDLGSNIVTSYGLDKFSTTFTVKADKIATGVSFLSSGTNNMTFTAANTGITKTVTDLTATAGLKDKYPVDGYNYLDMLYLLVDPGTDPDGQALLSAEFVTSIEGGTQVQKIELPSLPAKANYQTNVYGKLLTSSKDFNVKIAPSFGGTLLLVSKWDGNVDNSTAPAIDETNKTITVNQASDYIGLIKLVNAGNSYHGYTVKLTTDLDMAGKPMPVIADKATRSGSTVADAFQGVFDGQNHTISNAVISGDDLGEKNGAGVFAAISGPDAAVKNIKFENLTINNKTCEQTGVVGLVANGATVSNVHVLSGTVKGMKGTGAIVGRVVANGTVTGCSNAADVTAGGYNCGGIVGTAYYTGKGQTMTISNCQNSGAVTGENVCTGGIVGLSAANVSNCTNSGIITGNGTSVGGVIGAQQNYGTVTGCINTANVVNKAGAYGTGGIIGWLRYNGATTDYEVKEIITVDKCENSGNISAPAGSSGVGGIVGMVYNWANISNCKNTATSLSGGTFIGGIAGAQQTTETPPGMTTAEYGNYLVTLTGNTTTTTLNQMSGTCKALLIYVNDTNTDAVKLEGNTPENN